MSAFQLPVSRDLLLNELQGSRDILNKWIAILEKREGRGIPGVDLGGSEQDFLNALRLFITEVSMASLKCDNVVDTMQQALRS